MRPNYPLFMNSRSLLAEAPSASVFASPKPRRKLSFSMEARDVGESIILRCKGRLVYREEAAVLTGKVSDLLSDYTHVILNFGEVESIDSSGLGSLAILCLWAKARGGEIVFCNLHPRVERMLRLTNLNSVLEIHSTEAGALIWCEAALV
jgi:stage II sporulation protein AA (anti-sigma F factor antagonist)